MRIAQQLSSKLAHDSLVDRQKRDNNTIKDSKLTYTQKRKVKHKIIILKIKKIIKKTSNNYSL